MRLIQIPFSHNCIKVRKVLDLKGIAYETLDINPLDRSAVARVSGQGLVPVLEDGERAVADSTAILLHLEATRPVPPLLPPGARERAECLVLEDWADAAFMALTRRLAYWNALSTPGAIEALFAPGASRLRRFVVRRAAGRALTRRFGLSAERNVRDEVEARRLAELALARLGGGAFLVGGALSLADLTLAAMAAPLLAASDPLLAHGPVRELAEWSARTLGEAYVAFYRRRY